MKIEVEQYSGTQEEFDEWNKFVENSNNGTLFHRLDFLNYHPEDRFNEHHLMFYYKGENLIGVLPLAFDEKEEGEVVAKSPYGASYGGLVVEESVKFRYVDEMVHATLDYLEDVGVRSVEFRNTPREQHNSPSSYVEFHYTDKGLRREDMQVSSVVDLTRFEEPFDAYEGRCRRAIRKAKKKEVRVERPADALRSFHDILTKTLERYDKTPTHSLKELQELRERFPKRIIPSLAYIDGKENPIAGILSMKISDTTNLVFYNCHLEDYRDHNPVNLLLHQEIEHSKQQGYRYLDQGTSVENFEWNEGLVKFKESFGATGHLRNVYEAEL